MIEIITGSADETQALAEAVGHILKGGEMIELVGDVGGGKTTFIKGLARGLDIQTTIQSPTFTINRVYDARDGLRLQHFDFYRLDQPGIIAAELAEAAGEPGSVVAVEWSDIVHEVLPPVRITLYITSSGDTGRHLKFAIPETLQYVADAIVGFGQHKGATA